jgi:Capsular polysaccharide synthesis protein
MWRWYIVAAVFIAVVCLLAFRMKSNFQGEIPKTIWTYWVDEDLPELVQKCINSWRKYNPDYDIRILNKDTVSSWVPELKLNELKHNDKPARESDFVRLSVLSKYGGFWVDASMGMTKSLNAIRDIQSEKGCEFIGYYLEGFTSRPEYPVIESWFFACVPGSPFVERWRDEFMSINNHNSVDDYINEKRNTGVDLQKIDALNYLAIHASAQAVMQKLMSADDVSRKLHLMKAEDGPYKWLKSSSWDIMKGLQNLCDDTNLHTPVIKLRGTERDAISKNEKLKCVYKILE